MRGPASAVGLKGARIQRGSLSLQEAEDLVGQIDVGGPQSEEGGSGVWSKARDAIAYSALW
jgi:hypothetical protein